MIASLHHPTIPSDTSSFSSSDSSASHSPTLSSTTSRTNDEYIISSLNKIQKKLEKKHFQRQHSSSTPTIKQNNLHCTFCGQRNHTKDECWLRGPQFQPKTMSQYTHQFNLKHGNKPPQPSTRRVSNFVKTPPTTSIQPSNKYQVNALQESDPTSDHVQSYPIDSDDPQLNISSILSAPAFPPDDHSSTEESYDSEDASVTKAIHSITTHPSEQSPAELSNQEELLSLFGTGNQKYVSPTFRCKPSHEPPASINSIITHQSRHSSDTLSNQDEMKILFGNGIPKCVSSKIMTKPQKEPASPRMSPTIALQQSLHNLHLCSVTQSPTTDIISSNVSLSPSFSDDASFFHPTIASQSSNHPNKISNKSHDKTQHYSSIPPSSIDPSIINAPTSPLQPSLWRQHSE